MRAILPTETILDVYKHNLSKMSNRELFQEGMRLNNMSITHKIDIKEKMDLVIAEEDKRGIY